MVNNKSIHKVMVVGYVRVEKKLLQIIFPEVPKGGMRPLRSLIKHNRGRVHRNSEGGISITAKDPCCAEAISNLALDIGDLGIGLSVNAETIPKLNLL